jgi:FAD/FMN-containing dehydrogenase
VESRLIRPSDPVSLAPALAGPCLPRGLGRSYGDAALPAGDRPAVESLGLDRLIAFDPATGVLEAEAGVALGRILQVFVPRGFFLPVSPGTSHVTLGGALASNVHGKNHHRDGSIENFVEELEVVTPSGTRVCSAERDAELFRATVGGYGLTGFISRARIRLRPVRSPRMTVRRLRAGSLDGLFRLFGRHDAGWRYSVAWMDTLARGRAMGRGILMLGNHEGDGDPGETGGLPAGGAPSSRGPAGRGMPALRVPFPMPRGLLHPALLKAFNALYHRLGRTGGPAPEAYGSFFHPLDGIGDWNLLYGPAGFFQYQCVLPDPGEDGVAACLDFLSSSGLGAFLSVLKRCGDDHAMIPFCRRGYTLALDIPNRGAPTLRQLDRLDEIVIRHRGRVYLTKDARLSRDAFRAMYPEWRAWMEAVRKWNPEGAVRSRLAERLGLWET